MPPILTTEVSADESAPTVRLEFTPPESTGPQIFIDQDERGPRMMLVFNCDVAEVRSGTAGWRALAASLTEACDYLDRMNTRGEALAWVKR
jgi:hypothetical protein